MAFDLDPPENFLDQFREGAKWTEPDGTLTSQARYFLETLFSFNSGTWEKLGGPEDLISDVSTREFYPWIPSKEDPATDLTNLFSAPQRFQPLESIELKAGDTAFATTGSITVVCNNAASALITLRSDPDDTEEYFIERKDGPVRIISTIGISGDTEEIPILAHNGAAHIRFNSISGEYAIT